MVKKVPKNTVNAPFVPPAPVRNSNAPVKEAVARDPKAPKLRASKGRRK